ncbi:MULTISPECIES: SDR family oxidoreductase [Virgibacillus]|uniref:SDR family oxidoreductase n=1 Tax=Virgibacillus salarius TaxID=447199 RepID=A0A941I9B7_9BACI|nr:MULTISPECIES: SDR family oxidoreductase [Virgibacillus]MBR7795363.1 SDR family oxidoreductase [Virgibacillus salarius]NAZ08078.1 NAD(P)H-binding protein [Agaribacter marinus]
MKRVLVAGATGYLGRYVVKELKQAGYYVKVLVRSPAKLKQEGAFSSPVIYEFIDDIAVGDVSKAETIQGICADIDYVFSSVGITRQKGHLTFMDVDYQGNLHLLKEAEHSKVQRFMYINAHATENCPSALIKAKQLFVDKLNRSYVPHIIINPTGYFSDMTELFTMAQKGRVFLFGKGENKMNPIHGADLAEYCVASFSKEEISLDVGGPHVYTYRQMAELSIMAANPNSKITSVPLWLVKSIFPFLRISNKRQYELLQFFFYVMTHDVIADTYGNTDLQTYFENMNV